MRHDRHAVAEALGLLDVVRGHQDARALAAQEVDQRPQLLADLRVEADGRLVEQHQPRLVHEPAGDQQPPAHAAAELVDLRVAAVGEVGDPQRALDRRLAVARGRPGRGARRRAGSARRSASRRGCRAAGTTPHGARACLDSLGQLEPRISISPSSGIACAVSSRIVVDLPAPLGPSRPTHVPSGTSRSRWSTAVSSPKRLTTPRRLRAGTPPRMSGGGAQFGTGSRRNERLRTAACAP